MPKTVKLLGRSVTIAGADTDEYYRNLTDGGEFRDSVMEGIARVVPEDAVCIDVGANLGLHALGLAILAPDGFVHAFEPAPSAFRYLSENLSVNRARNVRAHNVALGPTSGTFNFHETPWHLAGSFMPGRDSPMTGDIIESAYCQVSCTTLDEFIGLHGIQRVDFVKIDVEGAELSVLEGARKTLSRDHPIVVLEFASYAFLLHQRIFPQDAIQAVRATFDRIFVMDRTDGTLTPVVTEHDCIRFLHRNITSGPVDDLLCCFEGHRLVNASAGFTRDRERLTAERDAARAELEAMRRTLSWRLTTPLRAVRRLASGRQRPR